VVTADKSVVTADKKSPQYFDDGQDNKPATQTHSPAAAGPDRLHAVQTHELSFTLSNPAPLPAGTSARPRELVTSAAKIKIIVALSW
jgi:hypothetical protein